LKLGGDQQIGVNIVARAIEAPMLGGGGMGGMY
jgi:hypothetical protein